MKLIAFTFLFLVFAAKPILSQAEDTLSLEYLLNMKISTSAKYLQKQSEITASISIITSEDIERYGYLSLDEIISSLRGFYKSYDRNYSYIGIRGFSRPTDYNNRIQLLVNGHKTNENVYGGAALGNDLGIPLESVDRIEVIRGPGSVLYGSNAMFSVINIITKKGQSVENTILSVETENLNGIKTVGVFGKEFNNGMDLFISGLYTDNKGKDYYYEEYDSPATNNGIAVGLDWEKVYGILGTFSYKNFTFLSMYKNREKSLPTGVYGIDFNVPASTIDRTAFFEASYKGEMTHFLSYNFRAYFDHYHYKGNYPYASNYNYDASDGNWYGGELQFNFDFAANNNLIAGLEFQDNIRADYRQWNETNETYNRNSPFRVFSLYLQNEYHVLKNLSMTLGLRYDNYSTSGSLCTPRGSIVYTPFDNSTFKLLYGSAYRAPNVYEMYYEDVPTNFKSNPSLEPERVTTLELVYEQRILTNNLITVSLYKNEINDLIDQFFNPVDSTLQFCNASKSNGEGVEFSLNTKMPKSLWGYFRYSYQFASDTETGERLTNSPLHILNFGLSYPLFNIVNTSIEGNYESGRRTIYDTFTSDFFTMNLNFATRQLLDRFKVSFTVKNLFDKEYYYPGGFEHIQNAIRQNGRMFYFKIQANLF